MEYMPRGNIDEGSPAWAGIDPVTLTLTVTDNGFPRVGGDRPVRRMLAARAS